VLRELTERDDWLLWVDLGTALPPWDVPEEFQEPYFAEGQEEEEEEEGADLFAPEPRAPLPESVEGPLDPDDDALYLRLQASYAAAVSYLDAGVGQLLEGLAGEVVLLLTSDRGLALGEHGMVGTGLPEAHNEVIHLPLLLRFPEGTEAGRRVAGLTQSLDLAPTLAELFGLTLGPVHGHSLLPLARGEAEEVRPYACAVLGVGANAGWALRTPDWALLLPPQTETEAVGGPRLYVKPDDRWEVNDVAPRHLELVEGLERTLRAFVAATAEPGPLRYPPLPEEAAADGPVASGEASA
jgi:arylsulfatase A-like enzyme